MAVSLPSDYLIHVGRTGADRIGRQRVSLMLLTGLMLCLGREECGCKCHLRVARKVDQKTTAKCFAFAFALTDALAGTLNRRAPQAQSQSAHLRIDATERLLS